MKPIRIQSECCTLAATNKRFAASTAPIGPSTARESHLIGELRRYLEPDVTVHSRTGADRALRSPKWPR